MNEGISVHRDALHTGLPRIMRNARSKFWHWSQFSSIPINIDQFRSFLATFYSCLDQALIGIDQHWEELIRIDLQWSALIGIGDRHCMSCTYNVHSSPKEVHINLFQFSWWPWVTDPDPGPCQVCQMVLGAVSSIIMTQVTYRLQKIGMIFMCKIFGEECRHTL